MELQDIVESSVLQYSVLEMPRHSVLLAVHMQQQTELPIH
jgi:hypothetical protein